MTVITKRILFVAAASLILVSIGIWAPGVQRFLGMFGLGWMVMDLATDIFPEVK